MLVSVCPYGRYFLLIWYASFDMNLSINLVAVSINLATASLNMVRVSNYILAVFINMVAASIYMAVTASIDSFVNINDLIHELS